MGIVRKVEILQIEHVNKSLLIGFFSSLFLSTICILALFNTVSTNTIILFIACSLIVFSFRLFLYGYDKNSPPNSENLKQWKRLCFVNSIASSLLFSAFGVSTYYIKEPTELLIIFITLAGVSAGAVSAYSAVKYLSSSFLLPVLIPLALVTALRNEPDYIYISFMTLLFALFMVKTSQSTHRTIFAAMKQKLVIKDLTDEKFELNERAKIKRDFFASMSHEIRTPLNGILGLIDILKSSQLSEKQKSYLATMQKSSNDLLGVINDVLDLSKMESGKFKIIDRSFDFRKEINTSAKLYEEKMASKNLNFKLSIDEALPDFIFGDPLRISQVINNFLSNAVKFTEKGEISLTIKKEGTFIIVNVSDTGRGIPDEKIETVFNKYDQINTQNNKNLITDVGTGLGLSISKKLVELMDGEIGVKSEANVGSTFWFKIPLIEGKTVDVTQEESFGNYSKKVLLVDDRQINLKVTKLILESLGCEVITAENGLEAITLALTTIDLDVIFMDIQMPVMDGITATQKLIEKGFKTPIIALSAQIESNLDQPFEEIGFTGYLTKPINKKKIEQALQQYA